MDRTDSAPELDPLGREVIPNEPLPRRPWWLVGLGLAGTLATVAFLLVFTQSLLDNIRVLDGGRQPFVNTGLATMGGLLSLALLLAYLRWFRRRGDLAALVTLLVLTIVPPLLVILR